MKAAALFKHRFKFPNMPISIESEDIQLNLFPDLGTFGIESRSTPGPYIHHARFNLRYRWGHRQYQYMDNWHQIETEQTNEDSLIHGPLSQISFHLTQISGTLSIKITFALPKIYPILLWKMEVQNRGNQIIQIDQIGMLSAGFLNTSLVRNSQPYRKGRIKLHPEYADLAFYSNGWGSWDSTRVYQWYEHYHRTRLGPFTRPMRQNPGTPHPKRKSFFGSDMYGVLGDRKHRTGILLGFLSQREHFGSLEACLLPDAPAIRLWANGDGIKLYLGQV